MIALVWIGLRLLRFPTLRSTLDRYAGAVSTPHRQSDAAAIEQVRWAIAAVASMFPAATCLVQALAADAILRRRGVACELIIGVDVRRDSAVPFQAHAWVHCNGAVVIGAIDNLEDFKVLCALRPV